MVLAENKVKRLLLVNHTTKTIHHDHHQKHILSTLKDQNVSWNLKSACSMTERTTFCLKNFIAETLTSPINLQRCVLNNM